MLINTQVIVTENVSKIGQINTLLEFNLMETCEFSISLVSSCEFNKSLLYLMNILSVGRASG